MPRSEISYNTTVIACYFGLFTQAIVINLAPILFIPLRETYGLSFTQLGSLVFVNFITQVICDIAFSGVSDKHGFRPLSCTAPLLASLGFGLFALTPLLLPDNIYLGLLLSTVVFSAAGGILEINISPVLNAIPSTKKASAMSILHSFYAWGQAAVVILTSLALHFFGSGYWQLTVAFWSLFPLVTGVLFMLCPLPPTISENKRTKIKSIILKPFFIVAMLTMFSGAATELCISQWSSSFMEKALGMNKLWGDVFGMAFFALMLGVGRLFYGLYGSRINLTRFMGICSFMGAGCYIVAALSPGNVPALAACGLAGFAASTLWPGTLILTSEKYPNAGAWMFAILACAGDVGGAVGPWLMGITADISEKLPFIAAIGQKAGLNPEQLGLRASMLLAVIFPLTAGFCLVWIMKRQKRAKTGRF